jgi:acetyl esterase
MKALKIALIAIAAVAASLLIIVSLWRLTPHGRLDWRAAILLKYITAANVQMFAEGAAPEESRAMAKSKSRLLKGRPPALPSVADRLIPGPGGDIPVRVYTPLKAAGLPVTLYYHGGGWFMGDLDTHDVVCRKLALDSGSIVMAVDYRLAPEHPFPAAVEDAYAAVLWAGARAAEIGGDPARVAVAGDSSGGNLAAVVCLLTRDRAGPRIAAQALFYPAVDLSRMDTGSYTAFADGYYLTRAYMEAFLARYAPNPADWKSPLISPLLAPDLGGLPPAVVVTAQFDPLRDEGEAYARRLSDAGVRVSRMRCEGILHGFLTLDGILPQADAAIAFAGAALKRAFASRY